MASATKAKILHGAVSAESKRVARFERSYKIAQNGADFRHKVCVRARVRRSMMEGAPCKFKMLSRPTRMALFCHYGVSRLYLQERS